MVVDSPPGRTMPSNPARSSGRRTGRGATPMSISAALCSATSPCNARMPMSTWGHLGGTSCHRPYHPRSAMRCSSPATSSPGIDAPRPRLTLATI